jgi:hypothetical protein
MKFGRQVIPLNGTLMQNIYSHILNHFKMVKVQASEVDVLPAAFSLAQQWVGIV